MENKKVVITNQSNSRVGINVPDLRFKRVWEKKNAKIAVDMDVLREIIYDTGVSYMFEQGILFIEDMQAKIELGLEPEEAKAPVNIIKLDDAALKRALGPMIVSDFKKFFEPLSEEQKHQVAEYAIANECTDFTKAEIIQKAIGINVISAIQLNRQNQEEK
jgi:hypothetical protein